MLKDNVSGAQHEETACTSTTNPLTQREFEERLDQHSDQISLARQSKALQKGSKTAVQLHCPDHMSVISNFSQVLVTFYCTCVNHSGVNQETSQLQHRGS